MEDKKAICAECGSEKVLQEFPMDRRAKSGYKNVCKACFNEKYKERNTKSVDSEKIIENYFKKEHPILYKALSIQAIAEERNFVNVLAESVQPKMEFVNLIKEYKS